MKINTLSRFVKVRLQLEPESVEQTESYIDDAKKLCKLFAFDFELLNIDSESGTIFINIYYSCGNPVYTNDSATIVKTFAFKMATTYWALRMLIENRSTSAEVRQKLT
jgi:hypothetical protein